MEFISSVFHYFIDGQKKFSHKSLMILISISLLVIVDNTLNFTQHYNNSRKFEQVELINKIMIDSTLTPNEKMTLKAQRIAILNHKSWRDKFYEFLVSINFKKEQKMNVGKDESAKETTTVVDERSYWIHFVTSSWIILVFMLLIPIGALSSKENGIISNLALLLFVVEPVFYFIAWLFAKVFSYIPILGGYAVYNYIVNVVLHLGVISLIGFVLSKANKRVKD